jgi:DNA-directed RNA polymerase subunit N (RpoN/RPB10)
MFVLPTAFQNPIAEVESSDQIDDSLFISDKCLRRLFISDCPPAKVVVEFGHTAFFDISKPFLYYTHRSIHLTHKENLPAQVIRIIK